MKDRQRNREQLQRDPSADDLQQDPEPGAGAAAAAGDHTEDFLHSSGSQGSHRRGKFEKMKG